MGSKSKTERTSAEQHYASRPRKESNMIEFVWTAVILLVFYLSVVMYGTDSRDGEDWYRHLR